MDRLLLFCSLLFTFSPSPSWAGTKDQISIELQQADAVRDDIYAKLKASMGEPIFKGPKVVRKVRIGDDPAEYKIHLKSKSSHVAKAP